MSRNVGLDVQRERKEPYNNVGRPCKNREPVQCKKAPDKNTITGSGSNVLHLITISDSHIGLVFWLVFVIRSFFFSFAFAFPVYALLYCSYTDPLTHVLNELCPVYLIVSRELIFEDPNTNQWIAVLCPCPCVRCRCSNIIQIFTSRRRLCEGISTRYAPCQREEMLPDRI